MFAILGWIVFGLIAGVIAKAIMPGRDPMGIIATMILGIIGSVIGGLVASFIWRTNTGFHPGGFILSLLGAIFALWIWRMVRSRTTTT